MEGRLLCLRIAMSWRFNDWLLFLILLNIFPGIELSQNKFHFWLLAFTLIVHVMLTAVYALEHLWSFVD